jgi:hypothetical protein
MHCSGCGYANDLTARFCESCGQPLAPIAPPKNPVQEADKLGPEDVVLGILKVIGSFFLLPAKSVVEVYKELGRVGAKKSAFSMETTPTPFLTWILISSRMLVPVFALLWVLLVTLGGFLVGREESMWGQPQHWWNLFGSHLGSGIGAFVGSLIGAFLFIWFANYCLDLLSILININLRVTEIAKEFEAKSAGEPP